MPAVPNDCSLRGAVANANAASSDDIINFDVTIFGRDGDAPEDGDLPVQTITLGGSEIAIPVGAGTLTINGPGANLLTVSGNNASRIISNSGVTTINGIRFTGGNGVGALNTGRAGALIM